MILRTKIFVKYLIFRFLDSLVPSRSGNSEGRILLIRLDAIGDYVLFRNFLSAFVADEQYRNHKITLLGNIAWRNIAENIDSEVVDDFIWLNKRKFERNLVYRYRTLSKICATGYDVVINPVYSREFFTQDMLMKKLKAGKKIGSSGNSANYFNWQIKRSKYIYTDLLTASKQNMFEFYRNKEFFETLLGRSIAIEKPSITPQNGWHNFSLPRNFALLFIGASRPFKKWPIHKYAEVARYLQENHQMDIVVCGGPNDAEEARGFKRAFQETYVDLVGKTTLVSLMGVIAEADILVSNETSAPHFAVALGVQNTFVISNGNHFGRFSPYPSAVADNYHAVFPPEIARDIERVDIHNSQRGYESNLSVKDITTQSVIEVIEKYYIKADIS